MNHWPVYSEQFAPLRPDCNSVAAEEISGDAAESRNLQGYVGDK